MDLYLPDPGTMDHFLGWCEDERFDMTNDGEREVAAATYWAMFDCLPTEIEEPYALEEDFN